MYTLLVWCGRLQSASVVARSAGRMATESIECWVQTGIPENDEPMFNAHIRSAQGFEWEVSHPLSKFSGLDRDLNSLVDILRDVPFPILTAKTSKAIAAGKHKDYSADLEKCRILLEKWIYGVISRMELYPPEVADIVEDFFLLPCGPLDETDEDFIHAKGADNSDAGGPEAPAMSVGSLQDSGSANMSDDQYTIFSGETESVGGTKRNKKKRILKGMKRRFEKLTGKQADPESPKAGGVETDVVQEQIRKGHLLKVRVIRGAVGKNNEIEYETQIIYGVGERPLRSDHTYHDFKELNDKLLSAFTKDKSYYAASVSSEFPPNHSSILGLSETQLSERSRLLDTWFRDLCSSYRSLRDRERQLVREFLVFDMTNPVDIGVQDKLAQGFVEANRSAVVGELGAAATALISSKPEEYETKSEGGRRRKSMLAFQNSSSFGDTKSENGVVDPRVLAIQGSQLSQKFSAEPKLPNRAIRRASSYDPNHTTVPLNSSPTPLMRAHSNGDPPGGSATKPKRRTSYAVTVPNADAPKWNPMTKDLPPLDDDSVAILVSSNRSHKNIERPMQLSSSLRENSDDMGSVGSGLEEKLLRIGMSDSNKRKKSADCCIIS